MVRLMGAGLRAALARWQVLLLFYAGLVVPGLGFGASGWAWLRAALDGSLATRTLLADVDPHVFLDLLTHHGAGLRMLAFTGGLILLGVWVWWVWLYAAAVAAFDEEPGLSRAARRGFEFFPRFLVLSLVANTAHAAAFAAGHFVARLMVRRTAESASEMAPYAIVTVVVVAVGGVVVFLASVHDHARVHVVATGSGALRAYGWAVRFVGGWEPRALPLSLAFLAVGLGIWALYQALGALLPVGSMSAVVVSLLWGQALLVVRCLWRLAALAAAAQLQVQSAGR